MTKKPDRRINRTRQALQSALIELILEKGYDAVSVQDIVTRANIGRSTFYTHYSSRDAVFSDSFKSLEISLNMALQQDLENSRPAPSYPLPYIELLLHHIDKNRPLYRALAGQSGGALAAKHIRKILLGLVSRDISTRNLGVVLSKTTSDALTHYLVGAITDILTWWLDHKTKWQVAEVHSFLTMMITSNLESATKTGKRLTPLG